MYIYIVITRQGAADFMLYGKSFILMQFLQDYEPMKIKIKI